jgi:transglutaminase-like putative cysteine protease
MILRATHSTTYLYSDPVSVCHTEVHLAPREHERQHLLDHSLSIHPEPQSALARKDYFGNPVTSFSISEPHETLTIASRSIVELRSEPPPDPSLTPSWEQARRELRRHADAVTFDAYQFVFESPRVPLGARFAAYAAASFGEDRPLLDAALDLCHRIFTGFRYDRRATTVATPLDEVLASRRGVCQDFAHFMIACLRSLGIAARYVSGYIRSGGKSVGGEASHAWVSIFCPGSGWLDLDPTNNVMPSLGHITLAWGRDYGDVTPLRGVAIGGGEQIINVSVEVTQVSEKDLEAAHVETER